ncbi:hypothetical protein B0T25DRAFT_587413 [Lasiosphaeria hispida]|uniref:Uncharacterized protein n=1 Tax=Lasiosphaeria hispida TaxID=260671 RepID=A0AAJ0HVB2_9PEZI|nr:hypothetical protein B0T25DRAFT_587413 [Lasiosphaeria hispida]
MSADTVSSLYPDRPIRPLPKRRLRERLSPEVADSIQYPPVPHNITPLFPYPYPLRDDEPDLGSVSREGATEAEPRQPRRNGVGIESDEDDAALRRGVANRAGPDPSGCLSRPPLKTEHGRHTSVHLPLSATSSVDGYDLLENTNNKKKRKIPTAGDAALNSVHAVNGSSGSSGSLTTVNQPTEGHGGAPNSTSTPYYGSGSFASGGQNVPGSGRGRYGRPRSGRSPLRPLSDSTNNWAGRNGKLRPAQWVSGASENTGIISTAIANAEKLPIHQGQENQSLLQQQLPTKRSLATTQFTFTCNSQVPGTLAWPGSDRRAPAQTHQPPPARQANENWSRNTQVAQANQPAPLNLSADIGSKELPSKSAPAQSQPAPAPKSTRRSLNKELAAAAKARRRQTQLNNRRHPPKPEDVWICHFCEYESIFGRPPEALIRQYELKDRKARQLEQQRRAQWERMKKGKHKGKKNSKLPAKSNSVAQEPHQPAGAHGVPMNSNYSQGTQSEEYYDDDDYEDEDYDPDEEGPDEQPSNMAFPKHLGGSSFTERPCQLSRNCLSTIMMVHGLQYNVTHPSIVRLKLFTKEGVLGTLHISMGIP